MYSIISLSKVLIVEYMVKKKKKKVNTHTSTNL